MTDYNMVYICVRTYGNGKFVNKVHNVYYEYLSQARRAMNDLNEQDLDCAEPGGDQWIFMPIAKFIGPI